MELEERWYIMGTKKSVKKVSSESVEEDIGDVVKGVGGRKKNEAKMIWWDNGRYEIGRFDELNYYAKAKTALKPQYFTDLGSACRYVAKKLTDEDSRDLNDWIVKYREHVDGFKEYISKVLPSESDRNVI